MAAAVVFNIWNWSNDHAATYKYDNYY